MRNVISYYSMLRTKPRGKYNVQVCTNICCLLRGGEEMLAHARTESSDVKANKGVTADGMFSRGRGRVHRRLLLGPGHAGELRLSREPDAGKGRQIIDEYREEGDRKDGGKKVRT